MPERVVQNYFGYSVGSAILAGPGGMRPGLARHGARAETACDLYPGMARSRLEIWRVMPRSVTPLATRDGLPSGAGPASGIGNR